LDLQLGANPPFIANGGGVAVLLQRSLEGVENFDAPAERFRESRRPHRHDHEFLEVYGTVGVRAAIEDVHHGAREKICRSVRGISRQVFVERLVERSGGGTSSSHGNGEDGVGAEARLRGSFVQLNHALVQGALVGSVEAYNGLGDFGVGVGDGFENAFAEVFRLVPVAELEGFVFAGRGTGGNSGAASRAVSDINVSLDSGLPANR